MNRALRIVSSMVAAGLATAVGCGGDGSTFADGVCEQEEVCAQEDGFVIDRKDCLRGVNELFADIPESALEDAEDYCSGDESCDYLECLLFEAFVDDEGGDGDGDGDGDGEPVEHTGCAADASCLSCTETTECAPTEACEFGVCRKRCSDDADCPDSSCFVETCADIPGAPCESILDCHGTDCIDYDANLLTVPAYCGGGFCSDSGFSAPCQAGQVCTDGECLQP